MAAMDWGDPTGEAQWLATRRDEVVACLANQGMIQGDVSDAPSWFIAPVASIWKVMEGRGGRLWLWAMAGDLPCDFIAADEAPDTRAALRTFASRWQDRSTAIVSGEAPDQGAVGPGPSGPELASLLRTRAVLLRQWADDDSMW